MVRFNEWGLAAWQLQYKYLRTTEGLDWRFLTHMSGEDAEFIHLPEIKNHVFGKVLSVAAPEVFLGTPHTSFLTLRSPIIDRQFLIT